VTRLDPDDLREQYADWRDRIAQMHDHARPVTNETVSLHRPTTPMAAWRVGLLTTAGAYLEGQPPFDVADPHGDPSIRLIPGDAEPARFRFAHSHYDTTRAEDDPNVVLPIGPLHDLVADGEVGAVSPVHVGMMGWNPDPARVIAESAPAVVEAFAGADVDVVVMSPG
jgi:D-proline reductase (dithiol) PrdB